MKNIPWIFAAIYISYILVLDLCDACSGPNSFCTVEEWAPWGSCNATCGGGVNTVQERQKAICCNPYKYSSLKECLQGCNISFSWWQANAEEYKQCGKCQRGGTFHAKQNSCICPSGYGGSCCDQSTRTIPCFNGICIKAYNNDLLRTTLPTTMKTTTTTTTIKPTTTKTTTIPTTTKTTTIPTTTKTTTKPTTTRTTTIPTMIKTTTIPTTTRTTTIPTTTKTTTKPTTIKTTSKTKGLTTGCSGNLCHQGTCIPMNNQYFYLCSPGYVGRNCDKDIDDCANSPCQYGTCKDMVDDFHCECVVFSKGKMCSKFTSWAIAFISLASLALLFAFCCCYRCLFGTDEEKKKVEPLRKKSIQYQAERPPPTERQPQIERPPHNDDW